MKGVEKELTIRSIKILDIGYATVFYIIASLITISLVNKYIYGKLNKEKEESKSNKKLVFDIIVKVWLISILAYIIRNVFSSIPFPLQGVQGYDHLRVKEVVNNSILLSFMILFDDNLQYKITILKTRFYSN
jgi:hypothetical protein